MRGGIVPVIAAPAKRFGILYTDANRVFAPGHDQRTSWHAFGLHDTWVQTNPS
jgi:hypothetical protein